MIQELINQISTEKQQLRKEKAVVFHSQKNSTYFRSKMQHSILQHKKVLPKRTLSSSLPILKEFKSHQHKTYQKFSLYLWACMCYQSERPCPLQQCLLRLLIPPNVQRESR